MFIRSPGPHLAGSFGELGAPKIRPGKPHWIIVDAGVRRPNQEWHWPRWLSMTEDDREELEHKLRRNKNAVPCGTRPPKSQRSFAGSASVSTAGPRPEQSHE